jgi:2,3-bisphosphoglycerate-independent phosphoglycerate mutase
MTPPKPLVLIILDGWGQRDSRDGNAVRQANTPVLDRLQDTYPVTQLACSGEAVGLPPGVMGNSEVGHLNMGAGRVVFQDLLRIDRSIADGAFFRNRAFVDLMDRVGRQGCCLHLMGLVSDGGVHSQLTHLLALLELAKQRQITNVAVHAILDGRDTAPDSGLGFVRQLQSAMAEKRVGRIASLCGRYYAMDRDQRWDRTRKAYALYTMAEGVAATDPVTAVQQAYQQGQTDEFVQPVAVTPIAGATGLPIKDGDGILFFNFRADRARQITQAFTAAGFDSFDRQCHPQLGGFVCMTRYDADFDLPIAFPPEEMAGLLGGVLSENGLRQLRIAETEKYAHVTYFFNGGEEAAFPLEERCLVPSPRDVATYDHKPEMSAREVTREAVSRIHSGRYNAIVLNYANMDMVGHTGNLTAAVSACETVDRCVGELVACIRDNGGAAVITADHGNAETMLDDRGRPHTAHTLNPVRLVLVDDRRQTAELSPNGRLADIAPTLLEMLGLAPSPQMTGRSLIRG